MKPNLKLSNAFDDLAPSSTLHINETVNAMWAKGQTVYHMGFGESRFAVHPKLQQSLTQHADKKSYLPARGLPELCTAVAEYYTHKLDCTFNASQVIVAPGSKAIIYGLQMVLDADVFLPTPSWVSYYPQAHLLGKSCRYIPSDPALNYRFDMNAFDALVQASNNACKLLIINSPNNPTGQMYDADFLQELASYCREHGIWVLSDEIYFQVSHGQLPHVSIAQFYPEGTFVLGGLSKHLSIGGWRLGVGLMPDTDLGKAIMQKLVVLASEVWSGVCAPVQYAAIQAYQRDPKIEKYVADCCALHRIRTQFFYAQLQEIGIRCTLPAGGFYVTANFDSFAEGLTKLGIKCSQALAQHLLQNYGIATLPGKDFGIPAENYSLRLSTSYLDLEMPEDADRLMTLYHNETQASVIMNNKNHPNMHAAIAAFSAFTDTLLDTLK